MLADFVAVIDCSTTNASVNVPHSAIAPNVDGQWTTPTEWSDASEYKISNGASTAYLRTKENSNYLFILVDFTTDQTGSTSDSISTFDYCGLFFDSSNDGGLYPKTDDFFLSHYYISSTYKSGLQTYVSQGTGLDKDNGWKQIDIPQGFVLERGFSSANDPYLNSKNHRIFEASIPMSYFEGNATGFYLFVRDANSGALLEFPLNSGGKSARSDSTADAIAPAPEKWGTLFFNQSSSSPTPTSAVTLAPTPIASAIPISVNQVILIVTIIIGIAIIVLVIAQRKR